MLSPFVRCDGAIFKKTGLERAGRLAILKPLGLGSPGSACGSISSIIKLHSVLWVLPVVVLACVYVSMFPHGYVYAILDVYIYAYLRVYTYMRGILCRYQVSGPNGRLVLLVGLHPPFAPLNRPTSELALWW